uniref:Uncharacterized protein n=1 Tax=Arundo donax TaxID=35708 RepID=A0A0A9BG04_ARUDO
MWTFFYSFWNSLMDHNNRRNDREWKIFS